MRKTTGITCGILAVLLFGFSPAVATAQSEVKGSGINIYSHGAVDGLNFFRHVAVNAWLDTDGVAHGTITYEGDVFQPLPGGQTGFRGGPSAPFLIDVTNIFFFGNSAVVIGVVVNVPDHQYEGGSVGFVFTDNSGTGEPDAINFVPIDAGNIIVR